MPNALDLYHEALRRFEARVEPANVWKAVQYLKLAERDHRAPAETAYDAQVLMAMCLRHLAWRSADRDRKQQLLGAALAHADRALDVLGEPYAEAHYQCAASMRELGHVSDDKKRLRLWQEALERAEHANPRTTRSLDDGQTLDGWGPTRLMGRLRYELPRHAGGWVAKSVRLLEVAWREAPNYAINSVYLAESLSQETETLPQARSVLDELLSHDAETYNPSRIVETRAEFELARRLRGRL